MKSVHNVLAIVEELAAESPCGVGELSRRTGLAKSTAQRCLTTLHDAGWIEVAADAGPGAATMWRLTSRFAGLAGPAVPDLASLAMPHMVALRDLSGDAVHLVELDGLDIVLRQRVPGPGPVQVVLPVGSRVPAYVTATGKAMLAALPRSDVGMHLPKRLNALTSQTVSTRRELFALLDDVAARGWASNLGEWESSVVAVAAPIVVRGRPIAALSVSTTPNRLPASREPELGAQVVAASAAIAWVYGGSST